MVAERRRASIVLSVRRKTNKHFSRALNFLLCSTHYSESHAPMLKLAPVTQDFSICLRCQSRLALGKTVRGTRRHRLQNAPTSRSFTCYSTLNQDGASVAHTDERAKRDSIITYTTSEDGRLPERPRGPPPKAPLGVDSMGEPAEVLVLRNARREAKTLGVLYTETRQKPLPTSLGGTSEALLKGIDVERGMIDADQVCSNLDRIKEAFMESRGFSGNILSATDYAELLSKLQAGFDKKHLAEYWRRSQPTINADALNLYYPYTSMTFARSAWNPEITSLEHTHAPSLARSTEHERQIDETKKLRGSDRGKQWHAENIIQRSWGLHREQKGNEVGEVSLRLKHTHLDLLLNHSKLCMSRDHICCADTVM